MSIDITNESDTPLDEVEFVALGRHVLDTLYVHPQAELEIRFVTTEVMTELNEHWMEESGPTDVLSFPIDELRPGTEADPSDEGMLGAIVLCPQVAAGQARGAGHSTVEEMLLLTTHGILHLLGYDHADPAEEKEMFDLQRQLLLTFLAGA